METKYAYLYSRVSTETQAEKGHGIARQLEAAEKFLENHSEYTLDNSTVITDAGVSAYSGANITDSAGLGGFLNAVRSGKVARGSLLVIEAPDRLTRLGIRKGQRLFDELADYGIDVGLVRFGIIIRHDDENDFTSSLIIAVGLYLGHLESKQKSERISETMRKRTKERREGKAVKAHKWPKWCTPLPDDTGFEINENGEIIKRMFELKLQGNGVDKIASILREEGVEGYSNSGVYQYLTNRTVLGEFQPVKSVKVRRKFGDGERKCVEPIGEPIKGYYPQLISEEVFLEANRLMKVQTTQKGTKHLYNNFLRGLAKCPKCGTSMTIKSTFNKTVGKNYVYYVCHSQTVKHMKSCGSTKVSMSNVIKYVVPLLKRFDYSRLAFVNKTQRPSNAYQEDIEKILASIEEDKKALGFLTGAAREAVASVIDDKQQEVLELRKKGSKLRTGTLAKQDVGAIREEIEVNPLDTPEQRISFNTNLHQFLERIELHKKECRFKFIEGIDVTFAFGKNLEAIETTLNNLYDKAELLMEGDDNDLGFLRLATNAHIDSKVMDQYDF